MGIEVSYAAGRISFDLIDLLQHTPKEQLDELVEALSCHSKIIEHVAAQIVDGCTENGYWGSKGGTYPEPYTPLDIASRKIAKAANEIAAKEIAALERSLANEKKSAHEWCDKYHALLDERRRYGP